MGPWTRRFRLLLPVELRHESHTASTNGAILSLVACVDLYNVRSMSQPSLLDQVADRVERLLVRYEELQRTNRLLAEQLEATAKERDSLRSRLNAARARVDALLERLPETNAANAQDAA
jgi:chromosome segregation ATPase